MVKMVNKEDQVSIKWVDAEENRVKSIKAGDKIEVTVEKIPAQKFGVHCKLKSGHLGLMHISQCERQVIDGEATYVYMDAEEMEKKFRVGDRILVEVLSIINKDGVYPGSARRYKISLGFLEHLSKRRQKSEDSEEKKMEGWAEQVSSSDLTSSNVEKVDKEGKKKIKSKVVDNEDN